MLNASRCSQNETRSSAQKPMPVSVPVAVVPVSCIDHAVCAVETVFSECFGSLVQCLLPGFSQAVLVVAPVTAVPPACLPACPVWVSNTPVAWHV